MLNKVKKIPSFSLIEIIVSLAIFSFIITVVLGISITLVSSQTNLQAQIFLAQSAQTTMELMSRDLRFGYNYSGTTQSSYNASPNGTIYLQTEALSSQTVLDYEYASNTQILVNAKDSPFILFEAQDGDPSDFSDQKVFCAYNNKLYKIDNFTVESNNLTYSSICSTGESILPEEIMLSYISFDVYGDNSPSPKNPMVRIKMKLESPLGGSMELQTLVTQRLVTYF